MRAGGRGSMGTATGFFGPLVGFAVGLVLGARIGPLLSGLGRRRDF